MVWFALVRLNKSEVQSSELDSSCNHSNHIRELEFTNKLDVNINRNFLDITRSCFGCLVILCDWFFSEFLDK